MRRTFLALTLSLTALAAGLADARDAIELPLRIHLIRSSVQDLDGASVGTASVITSRVAAINAAFEPAGIRFRAETRTERPPTGQPLPPRTSDKGARKAVLHGLVTPGTLVAPRGLDLFVVRDLSRLDLGGAYQCSVAGAGQGAAFISVETARGATQPARKWAHELGHALGLAHTPCTPEFADNLMMSGRCEHADRARVALLPKQIETVRAQARRGGPAPCKARGER